MIYEIPFAIILFIIAIIRIRKEPRSFLNAILIAQGIFSLIRGSFVLWGKIDPGLKPVGEGVYQMTTSLEIRSFLYMCFLLFFIIVGIYLIISNILLLRKERLCIAHVLPFVFGFFCIGFVILSIINKIYFNDASLLSRFINSTEAFILDMALYIPFMVLAYFLYNFIYKLVRNNRKPDYIIVLGAGLIENRVSPILAKRLDEGIKLYQKYGCESMFVVSGGKGSDEVCSEAEAMKNYLLEQGIPMEKILMEDHSVNTLQNLKFSKQVIEAHAAGSNYYCAVVTNDFHMLRGAIYSKAAGVPASAYGCKTARYFYPAAALRECVAFIVNYKLTAVMFACIFFVVSYFDFFKALILR